MIINLIRKVQMTIFFVLTKKKIKGIDQIINIFSRIFMYLPTGINTPIPIYKQNIVKFYAKNFLIDNLIETGTYLGDMLIATKNIFTNLYSIEIDKKLYERAKIRCSRYKNIQIFYGNSAEVLSKILKNLNNSCLFWLDAHYCGKGTGNEGAITPIMKELKIILDSKNLKFVILIDDARKFNGKKFYPTIEEVRNSILENDKWTFLVKNDIIRIY